MLFLWVFTWLRVLMRHPGMSWDFCFSVLLSSFLYCLIVRGEVLDIPIAQRGPPRPAWTAAGRCPYGRYQVAQVANDHQRHLGPATSRPLRADARKALSGAGGQWPPVTSRPGGGKLPPKDLEAGDW